MSPTGTGDESLAQLLDIMRRLRAPDGCAWDRQQSFASIASYTVEEAYEVADAIERADMADLKDELGDLLFQVVFHAQMASETGAFNFAEVARTISDKLIRRFPPVELRHVTHLGESPGSEGAIQGSHLWRFAARSEGDR